MHYEVNYFSLALALECNDEQAVLKTILDWQFKGLDLTDTTIITHWEEHNGELKTDKKSARVWLVEHIPALAHLVHTMQDELEENHKQISHILFKLAQINEEIAALKEAR
jgi:DNA-directed RNA polymerase specialized sigma subunit